MILAVLFVLGIENYSHVNGELLSLYENDSFMLLLFLLKICYFSLKVCYFSLNVCYFR